MFGAFVHVPRKIWQQLIIIAVYQNWQLLLQLPAVDF